MKATFIAIAAAATLVSAQDATAPTTSTLIPTNITSSCSAFLTQLNSDSSIQSCVTPLINATNSFSPANADASASNTSTTQINYALATLCKSTGCSDGVVRKWLSSFYSNCSAELTSSTGYNERVRELYDVLYVVNPLKSAICAIDSSNQDYCVKRITGATSNSTSTSAAPASSNSTTAGNANANSTTAGNSTAAGNATASGNSSVLLSSFAAVGGNALSPIEIAANNLYIAISVPVSSLSKRVLNALNSRQSNTNGDDAQHAFTSIVTPNTTTYRNTNLPFLFLQPSMISSQLCTPCTREIMVAYIKWEVAYPYALGLSQSPILGGQSALWNAINSTCGTNFVNAITSQVGISASSLNFTSGAASALSAPFGAGLGMAAGGSAVVALIAGAMTFLA